MRSPINWGVLGLLIERPGYGYDLFHRFERTYGELLELSSPSQIYKALNAAGGTRADRAAPRDERCRRRGAAPAKAPLPGARRGRARLPGVADRPGLRRNASSLELLALQVGALPAARCARRGRPLRARTCSQSASSAPPALDGASALARRLAEHAKQLETGWRSSGPRTHARELEAAIDAQAGAWSEPQPAPLRRPHRSQSSRHDAARPGAGLQAPPGWTLRARGARRCVDVAARGRTGRDLGHARLRALHAAADRRRHRAAGLGRRALRRTRARRAQRQRAGRRDRLLLPARPRTAKRASCSRS